MRYVFLTIGLFYSLSLQLCASGSDFKNSRTGDSAAREGLSPENAHFLKDLRNEIQEDFWQACQEGDVQTTQSLLALSVDVNGFGELDRLPKLNGSVVTPFGIAVLNDHRAVCVSLARAKASLNCSAPGVMSPLLLATQKCNRQLVRALLRAKASPDELHNSDQPLIAAIQGGDTETVQTLLAAKADANKYNIMEGTTDTSGLTPMEAASQVGRVDLLNRLVQAKAAVGPYGDHEEDPLSLCMRNEDVIKFLLDHKSDPNCAVDGAPSLLSECVEFELGGALRLLLRAKADLQRDEHNDLHRMLRDGEVSEDLKMILGVAS